MQHLTTSQRQHLRRLAHELKPVIQIGKQGLSDTVIGAASQALDAHELIKVKFMDFREQKREFAQELADALGSSLILLIGNVAILYRQQADPERRKIILPA